MVRLLLVKDILSKKTKDGWVGLILVKIRLILENDIPSKKKEGGASTC